MRKMFKHRSSFIDIKTACHNEQTLCLSLSGSPDGWIVSYSLSDKVANVLSFRIECYQLESMVLLACAV